MNEAIKKYGLIAGGGVVAFIAIAALAKKSTTATSDVPASYTVAAPAQVGSGSSSGTGTSTDGTGIDSFAQYLALQDSNNKFSLDQISATADAAMRINSSATDDSIRLANANNYNAINLNDDQVSGTIRIGDSTTKNNVALNQAATDSALSIADNTAKNYIATSTSDTKNAANLAPILNNPDRYLSGLLNTFPIPNTDASLTSYGGSQGTGGVVTIIPPTVPVKTAPIVRNPPVTSIPVKIVPPVSKVSPITTQPVRTVLPSGKPSFRLM